MDWTLEVVIVPVSDIDRAIEFYRDKVGFDLDHDTHVGDQRYWADRLHRLSVTPKPFGARTLDADRLARAILATAADPARIAAAEQLAGRMHDEDGVVVAADALEISAPA